MSTVCAPPLLGGLVDLDVLDNQVAGVKTLGIGVGLSVLEETEQELGGLDGPAGLGDTELLAYTTSPISKGSPKIVPTLLHLGLQSTSTPRLLGAMLRSVPWAVRPVLLA